MENEAQILNRKLSMEKELPQNNPVGRPRKYQTPEELQIKIDEYFETGMNMRKVVVGPPQGRRVEELPMPTICGLVRYCGFVNRQSFYAYEAFPEFSDTIKAARNRIEQEYEEDLKSGLGAGAIFALKNFGWKDVQELSGEIKGLGPHVVIIERERGESTREPETTTNRLPADTTTDISVRPAE